MPKPGVLGVRFCSRCGSVMYPRATPEGQVLFCPRCGHSEGVEAGIEVYRIRREVRHAPREKTLVVGEQPAGAHVVRGVRCDKCGWEEAYFWMLQTRAADEPATRFYRCTRCGHTWREYA